MTAKEEGRRVRPRSRSWIPFGLIALTVLAAFSIGATGFGMTPAAASVSSSGDRLPSRGTPTLGTDGGHYVPGATVSISGTGWSPGETVALHIAGDSDSAWALDSHVVAGPGGNFSARLLVSDEVIQHYTVAASGPSSGSASTQFTVAVDPLDPSDGRAAVVERGPV